MMNEAIWKAIFISNIRKIIEERHMTLKEVSSMTGLSISAISRLLAGRSNPSWRQARWYPMT